MKIALVHPRMDIPGGAERLISWIAKGLSKKGLEVTIFTEKFNPRLIPLEPADGIRVELFKKGLLDRFINSKIMDKKAFARQLSSLLKGFSVVISFNFPSYWWVAEAKRISDSFPLSLWFCNEPLRRLYRDKADSFLMDYFKSEIQSCRGDIYDAHCCGSDKSDPYIDTQASQLEEGFNRYNLHLKEEVRKRLEEDKINMARLMRDRKIDKDSVSSMDKVLAISSYTAESLKSIFGIEPKVCYPGIPLRGDNSGGLKASVRRGNTILTIGWSSPKKNINNVLEAVKILRGRGSVPGFKLKIIGHDARLCNIKGLIEDLGIGDIVELIGRVDEEELFQYYRNAKAVVYIPIDEPFGLVPVEAMMCGTPVVVSNHGGPGEIVQDGKTGIHVDPFDPNSVADGLERLLNDDKLVNEMGQNGYNLMREKFTIDHFVERLIGDNIIP